jgi:hypothetical protein
MESPRKEHSAAVKAIGRYLAYSKDMGIIFEPMDVGLEWYADADFSGNWHQTTAESHPITARSRTGYVIKYAGCPIQWVSRLQTETALRSTKSEYIALSQALRDVISLQRLNSELHNAGFNFKKEVPNVHCKALKHNNGARV